MSEPAWNAPCVRVYWRVSAPALVHGKCKGKNNPFLNYLPHKYCTSQTCPAMRLLPKVPALLYLYCIFIDEPERFSLLADEIEFIFLIYDMWHLREAAPCHDAPITVLHCGNDGVHGIIRTPFLSPNSKLLLKSKLLFPEEFGVRCRNGDDYNAGCFFFIIE